MAHAVVRILCLLLMGATPLALSGQSAAPAKRPTKSLFTLFISSRRVFRANTPVEVKVSVTNTSSHDINASTGNIKGFAYGYDYDVRNENGLVVSQKQIDATHQSSAQIIMLKPGTKPRRNYQHQRGVRPLPWKIHDSGFNAVFKHDRGKLY